MIRHEHACFSYAGRQVLTLNNLELHVRPGEVVLVTGGSGSGKSTLLRTINGLIPHATTGRFEGDVWLAEKRIQDTKLNTLCSVVGTVYQNPSDQLTHSWVEDEVAFGPQNLGLPRATVIERTRRSLEDVGMLDSIKEPIHVLSGGQRQRVALASVLAMNPRVLVLDEPTTQLDPISTRTVLNLLERLRDERELTIILVDHRTEESLRWVDRVVVLAGGRVVDDTNWDELSVATDRLSCHGVEVPELLQVSEALTCGRAIRTAAELATWCQSKGIREDRPRGLLDKQPIDSTRTGGDVVVEMKGIRARYGRRYPDALQDIDLSLYAGELTAVLGPNASGKSTLLRVLAGGMRPHHGELTWMGQSEPLQPSSLVPQDPDLTFVAETVWEEVAFALQQRSVPDDEIRKRVSQAIENTALTGFIDDPPYALSQGQRQRVALAAAMALEPSLLLLDEPTTGQDRFQVHQILSHLKQVFVADGGSLLMATHDLRTALTHADRILVLADGAVIHDGTPQAILADEALLTRAGHISPPLARASRILGGPMLATPEAFAEYWRPE